MTNDEFIRLRKLCLKILGILFLIGILFFIFLGVYTTEFESNESSDESSTDTSTVVSNPYSPFNKPNQNIPVNSNKSNVNVTDKSSNSNDSDNSNVTTNSDKPNAGGYADEIDSMEDSTAAHIYVTLPHIVNVSLSDGVELAKERIVRDIKSNNSELKYKYNTYYNDTIDFYVYGDYEYYAGDDFRLGEYLFESLVVMEFLKINEPDSEIIDIIEIGYPLVVGILNGDVYLGSSKIEDANKKIDDIYYGN